MFASSRHRGFQNDRTSFLTPMDEAKSKLEQTFDGCTFECMRQLSSMNEEGQTLLDPIASALKETLGPSSIATVPSQVLQADASMRILVSMHFIGLFVVVPTVCRDSFLFILCSFNSLLELRVGRSCRNATEAGAARPHGTL